MAGSGTAATTWSEMGDCALVVGATYPNELARVRSIVGDMPILVPGVGAQGGESGDLFFKRQDLLFGFGSFGGFLLQSGADFLDANAELSLAFPLNCTQTTEGQCGSDEEADEDAVHLASVAGSALTLKATLVNPARLA